MILERLYNHQNELLGNMRVFTITRNNYSDILVHVPSLGGTAVTLECITSTKRHYNET